MRAARDLQQDIERVTGLRPSLRTGSTEVARAAGSFAKIQEQMNLAWHYGADRVWIVNVGDLKPMEFPIEFFLALAWDPERWPSEELDQFSRAWAAREFGVRHAAVILPRRRAFDNGSAGR